MAIHLVQRAQAYLPCSRARADGDVVVLLGEGVAAALIDANDCYASDTDVVARGLVGVLPTSIKRINDAQLVALCVEHTPVVTWTKA